MFGKGWKIFQLFNFSVRVDISWLFIALFLLWTLAAILFPMQYPSLTGTQYLVMGLIATAGLFFSIVVHEFCHALVARHFNLPMRGITLFIFGGIAEMNDEPPSPKAEFFMAIAGPIASALLALIFWGIYKLGTISNMPVVFNGIFDYLWQINLILVVFNMIPAFPLDGGRIVRSILWKWKGRLRWATRISSEIGAGFGFILIILGIVSLFAGNLIGAFWYVGIGLFLRWAAKTSYGNILVKESLENRKIEKLMNQEPKTAFYDETIEDLVENHIYKFHHKNYPVLDNKGDFVGIVGTKHIRNIPRNEWNSKKIFEVLEKPNEYNTVSPKTEAFKVLKKLSHSPEELVAVTEDDKLKGVLTFKDIMDFIAINLNLSPNREDLQKTAEHMTESEINHQSSKSA